jgi:hypothetical protein
MGGRVMMSMDLSHLVDVAYVLFRELSKAVEPSIKQEDEGKFRCKTCQKLFKATSFVEKHIANKHPELVKQLDDVMHLCRDSTVDEVADNVSVFILVDIFQ